MATNVNWTSGPHYNQTSYQEPGRPSITGGTGQSRLSGKLTQPWSRQPTVSGSLVDLMGKMFGSGGMFGGSGSNGAAGLGPMTVQSPYNPADVYDPTSLQIARNQMRAQVPTALSSAARHTPAGVSSTLGTMADISSRQNALRMDGEDATQQAMLQARLANAQNQLAGQHGAYQSALGLAGGEMDRAGIDQRLRYGLANQGLDRGNIGLDALMSMLGLIA